MSKQNKEIKIVITGNYKFKLGAALASVKLALMLMNPFSRRENVIVQIAQLQKKGGAD